MPHAVLCALAILCASHGLPSQKPPAPVDPRIPAAIERGLAFLAAQQQADGSFPPDLVIGAGNDVDVAGQERHRVGVTGLALLALLGGGNTLRLGPYRGKVGAGCKWLVDQQDPNDGHFLAGDSAIDQAFATLAVIEAYGLSDNYRPFRKPAQLGVDFLLGGRGADGGWGLRPGARSDSLMTAIALHVMGSAEAFQLGAKVEHGDAAWRWLDSVTNTETGRPGFHKRGQALVRPPDALAFPAEQTELLAAASLWGRLITRPKTPPDAAMQAAVATILKCPPRYEPKAGSVDFLYWYYATAALRRYGGEAWRAWAPAMTKVVLEHESQQADAAGSWDPVDAWGTWGGRVQSTALMVMVLQVLGRPGR